MKRRSFIKKSAIFSLPAFLGGFSVSAMPSKLMESMINGDNDKVLVLIDLSGGNDGLNTFVPLDVYDNLVNARQNIVIPQNQLLNFSDTIGLHPELSGIKNLYDNGNLSLVQGVGYPNQNRSHFRSADIWNTASDADEYLSTGWMGRYLDHEFPGYPGDYPNMDCPDPFAITMGSSISGTCQGMESNFSMAIINVNDVGGLDTGIEAPLPNDCYGQELGYLVETFKKANVYGERVIDAVEAGNSNENLYPNTNLANQLKTVAKMISGGLQTKIYVLKLGGFDTHADQIDPNDVTQGLHANLLKTLSDAIYAFQEDIKLLEVQDRVVGMTFSEFGRKIRSNGGLGTDHGSAAPMILFGSCIGQHIIGDNPQIGTDVDIEEGVAMQYDFRSVYGSVLMDWFEVSETDVVNLLTEDFQYVPVIGECISTRTRELNQVIEANAFPSPFENNFTLRFSILENAKVSVDLYDVLGKVIKNVSNQTVSAGTHDVFIETHQLPSGVYFARIQAGDSVKTMRVVKR
ncbi:MAG: hypothetical protein ACI8P3_001048 [Saprospiraceae bacterium]|jgi:uncharacterized protein (DUF1501 family)